MVWIYGGSFIFGSTRAYDGSTLAVQGKVIVVSILQVDRSSSFTTYTYNNHATANKLSRATARLTLPVAYKTRVAVGNGVDLRNR